MPLSWLRPYVVSHCLFSCLSTPTLDSVGSCIVPLALRGVILAIDDAAVNTPAAFRAALPLQPPLRSLGRDSGQPHRAAHPQQQCPSPSAPPLSMLRPLCLSRCLCCGLSSACYHGGQLHRAAHPERHGPRHCGRRCRGPSSPLCRTASSVASPLRHSTRWDRAAQPGVLIAIAAAVDAPAALRVALRLQPPLCYLARNGGQLLRVAHPVCGVLLAIAAAAV